MVFFLEHDAGQAKKCLFINLWGLQDLTNRRQGKRGSESFGLCRARLDEHHQNSNEYNQSPTSLFTLESCILVQSPSGNTVWRYLFQNGFRLWYHQDPSQGPHIWCLRYGGWCKINEISYFVSPYFLKYFRLIKLRDRTEYMLTALSSSGERLLHPHSSTVPWTEPLRPPDPQIFLQKYENGYHSSQMKTGAASLKNGETATRSL